MAGVCKAISINDLGYRGRLRIPVLGRFLIEAERMRRRRGKELLDEWWEAMRLAAEQGGEHPEGLVRGIPRSQSIEARAPS
ncbi:MAG: hypothetical protein GY725_25945 [bacterium]|nr:hypothetical protein [bacterium]